LKGAKTMSPGLVARGRFGLPMSPSASSVSFKEALLIPSYSAGDFSVV
jgi:hypothetical protein